MKSSVQNHAPKRVVIKLGTGLLTSVAGELNTARISAVCAEIAALRARGTEVIVVSSGAVGLGMAALGLAKRPKDLSKKQACAAVGQSRLMQTWQAGFAPHRLTIAQVLLTHDDLRVRARYLGVQETLRQLIGFGTMVANAGAGKFSILSVSVVSGGAAVLITFLELFVAFLQAFIFMFLTAVFISLMSHHDESHEHAHSPEDGDEHSTEGKPHPQLASAQH